jgi:thioredoxin reductase
MMKDYDVAVIGGGPAGLSAALSSSKSLAKTLIIEREDKLGGILKQCIHDGFGLIKFNRKMTGPEYALQYIKLVKKENIEILTSTFVTDIKYENGICNITAENRDGITKIRSKAIILATGCRERSSRQIFIHGTRPAGIFTAGTAQHFVNIDGYLPTRKCVILGSGDVGLIMARRLTLEGAKVIGVYEAKSTPSGLTRNISQCLKDYNIPLYTSKTVTRVYGDERVTGVLISDVDSDMNPIDGTQQRIDCDALILSVGLIPENETAEMISIDFDGKTKGPIVDQTLMTNKDGIFSCGNSLHVNDLVDYVSESGETAGLYAAKYAEVGVNRRLIPVNISNDFLYVVPQFINKEIEDKNITIFLRVSREYKDKRIQVKAGDYQLFNKRYSHLRPPEMERISFNIEGLDISSVEISLV